MIHKRIITLSGDKAWIERTLKNSLPEGDNKHIFGEVWGEERSINVETIEANNPDILLDCVNLELPTKKPEARYNKGG